MVTQDLAVGDRDLLSFMAVRSRVTSRVLRTTLPSVCPTRMFDPDAQEAITIGGVTFSHAKRNEMLRCHVCCGGMTGLAASKKWSSWSPGRLDLPQGREDMLGALVSGAEKYFGRPPIPGGYNHVNMPGTKMYMTCGNCQIVCAGEKTQTAKNVKILHNSGCVVQYPDGEIAVLPPDDVEDALAAMPEEHRKLYV